MEKFIYTTVLMKSHTRDDSEFAQEVNWLAGDPKTARSDLVLVKFLAKKTIVYYISRVEDIDGP